MAGKWQVKDHEAEKKLFDQRLVVAGILIVVLFSALVFQLVNLQIYQYEYFTARSDGNRLHSQYVPPARGLIFDRSGTLLADNQPIFNLTVVREQVENFEETLEFLKGLITLTDDDIEQFNIRMQRNRVPFSSVPLRYILDEEEKSRVAVNGHLLPGIAIEPQFVRRYPLSDLTAHSIGYVSEINQEELDSLTDDEKENYGGTNHIGKTGIERTYED
ncbi:MAG: penicillin-binding protein 2, partial [Pseudomonadota bacterium]|nr:penicillin-binding protein 2 [Pseudomonadota bacterium]